MSCISMFQIYIVEIFRTLVEEEHALIKASIRPDLLPGVKFSGGFLVPAYTPLVQAACSSTLRLLPGAKCSGVSQALTRVSLSREKSRVEREISLSISKI